MKQIQRIFGDERFVTDNEGNIESVMLTFEEYAKIVETFENLGLAQAMKEAEGDKVFSTEEALDFLGED